MSDKTQLIRERAYQIWQEQGEPECAAVDIWLQAERELRPDDSGSVNEGEGSQTGARRYDEETTAFAHSGKVETAAAEAVKALDNPAEAAEMAKAEEEGKRRGKAKTGR